MWMEFLQDARYAVRQMRRAPWFSLTVLSTLTIAVGATAAMSGVLRATLLNALPYPDPDKLVQIGDHNLRGFKTNGLVGAMRIADLRQMEHNGHRVFESVGFEYSDVGTTLSIDGQPGELVEATGISGDFFRTVGVAPALGRAILPSDVGDRHGVAVISHRLWLSRFAGDPRVAGRTVRVGTEAEMIVGVMPASFDLPAGTDLWHPGPDFPVTMRGYRGEGSRFLHVIARVNPAESLSTAKQATTLLAAQLARAHPETDAAWDFTVTDLRSSLFGEYRQALLLLVAAVGLVLLVAAVNIAGLQLSRNARREPEFAVRSALGISRARLARQLLTESLLLVTAGSALGVIAGLTLLRLVSSRLPASLLSVERPHVDGFALSIAMLTALLVGVFTGFVPALQSTRASLATSAGRTLGRHPRRLGRTFTAVQIGLALVLLTLSATVLEGLYGLMHLRLGFAPEQVQTFTVDMAWGKDRAALRRVYAGLEDTLSATPGVTAVGAASALPLYEFSIRDKFDIAGLPPTPEHDTVVAEGRSMTPGYLHALGIPLLAGRNFTARDAEDTAPKVLMVNETLANRYFAGRSALGQHLMAGNEDLHRAPGAAGGLLDAGEIVGIVGDVRGTGGKLGDPLKPEVYDPAPAFWPHMHFAVRSPLPASVLERKVKRIVASLDGTASVGTFGTLTGSIQKDLAPSRLNAVLLTGFAAVSLLLVVIGVYGLVAFDLQQRTRELGLRIALGATRGGVLRLLLRESARVLLVGLLLGVAGSVAASRLMKAAVFGAEGHVSALLLLTMALLSAAVLLATLVPARRAAQVDPMQALRAE